MAKNFEQQAAPEQVMGNEEGMIIIERPISTVKMDMRKIQARALPDDKGLVVDISMKIKGEGKNDYDARSQAREEITQSDEFQAYMNLKEVCERLLVKHDQARQRENDIELQIIATQRSGEDSVELIESKISELVAAKVAVGTEARIAWDELVVARNAFDEVRNRLLMKADNIASKTRLRVAKTIKKDAEDLLEEIRQVVGDQLLKLAQCNHALYRNSVGTLDSKMILQTFGVQTDIHQRAFSTQLTGGVQTPPSNSGVNYFVGHQMVFDRSNTN
ncbi:hypothetical protein [Pirellula sp. SH-Sr6A]|uniref:hypothetical protein n=1 Tax=Pirellula sp. SH-Sr6A TaxID=1632865 RepID=UPI0011BAE094|nr:hypothetical protein [Pirellula sp. SH-Sr6A]